MPAVPVLEQYQRVKQAHPDAIVLFRLGDFYETFGEDAERAAPILGVTLTGREMGKGQRFPMAGVPYHACEAYVGKLLKAGLRVAVCDQVEEPVLKGRGLVRREVVRVLTPGMVLEDAYLEGARSNYAVAVCINHLVRISDLPEHIIAQASPDPIAPQREPTVSKTDHAGTVGMLWHPCRAGPHHRQGFGRPYGGPRCQSHRANPCHPKMTFSFTSAEKFYLRPLLK